MCLSVLLQLGKNLLPYPSRNEVHSISEGRLDVAFSIKKGNLGGPSRELCFPIIVYYRSLAVAGLRSWNHPYLPTHLYILRVITRTHIHWHVLNIMIFALQSCFGLLFTTPHWGLIFLLCLFILHKRCLQRMNTLGYSQFQGSPQKLWEVIKLLSTLDMCGYYENQWLQACPKHDNEVMQPFVVHHSLVSGGKLFVVYQKDQCGENPVFPIT